VSGTVSDGLFVLSVEGADGVTASVKVRPAFGYGGLDAMPGCALNVEQLPEKVISG
jgi:hypothetical protein